VKLTPARWAAYLRKPDPSVLAILVFGPDRGLVRERADQLATLAVGPTPDPFRCVELTTSQVRAAPSLLLDEALAFGLVPGRRLLRVRDASDALVESVRLLLAAERLEAFVLLEAGDLAKRSTLRDLMERASNAAAVPCYEDDPESLRQLIVETLASAALRPSPEAIDLLVAHLGSDRGVTRSELEKLILYVGAGDEGTLRSVTVDDVVAVVDDARSATLGAVAMAVGSGDPGAVTRATAQAAANGLEAIGLLRVVTSHLQRLYGVVSEVATGQSLKAAIGALRPPVFFRELESFTRQCRLWSPRALETALLIGLEAELQCKQTGAPQRLLAEHACLRIAALPRAYRNHLAVD
jgi:DNA polymerase III, delta subunit